jgi:uncharacterized membrane protein YgcG
MKITKIAIATVAVLLGATSIFAQQRKPIPPREMNKYVVSAKAGVVNVAEGDASVTRAKPFAMPEMLISGDELLTGDTVKTGASGRAEVLLNPGCYLRLGEGSEFVFLFDNFTNKIKLLRGSAVIEASSIDDLISVETPKAEFEIARAGLYRFNVGADARAEVAVRKGRVFVGTTTIKEGKRAVVESGTPAIARLNKQDADALDDWSKDRAKALIAANSRLSNTGMRRTLGMSLMSNAWIYDPFCRCYTFLPLTGGFASPYGWNYSVCNPYWYFYSGSRYNNGRSSGSGSGNGSGQPSSGGSGGGSASGGGSSSRGGGSHSTPPATPSDSGRGGVHNPSGSDRSLPAAPSSGPRRP